MNVIKIARIFALILFVIAVLVLASLMFLRPVAEHKQLVEQWDYLFIVGVIFTMIIGIVYATLKIVFNDKKLF
jgi:hypothetical protein